MGLVFRPVADSGAVRLPGPPRPDAGSGEAVLYAAGGLRGLGHLRHGGPGSLRTVSGGVLWGRAPLVRPGRVPFAELGPDSAPAGPGLHHPGGGPLEEDPGAGEEGPGPGADGPGAGCLHRLSGRRQLQSLLVFPVLRRR